MRREAYGTMGGMPRAEPADAGSFTPLDFQLVLLRRMADHNTDLVEDARRALGASAAQMREANRRWQAMRHAPRRRGAAPVPRSRRRSSGGTLIRSVLGPPESVTPRRIGDLSCEALRWPVPLWPDLRFEVLVAPSGATWNEWLVRAPGARGPALRTAADLTPWSCTVDEAARAFAPARPLEGTAPTRWGLAFAAPDGSGVRREYVAEFTYGLLQRVTGAGRS